MEEIKKRHATYLERNGNATDVLKGFDDLEHGIAAACAQIVHLATDGVPQSSQSGQVAQSDIHDVNKVAHSCS
jgi:hypothetical protein